MNSGIHGKNVPIATNTTKNDFAVDIATEFLSLVRRYSDDTQMEVEALHLKLGALDSMLERLHPVQKKEAGVTANLLLSLIDRMKNDASLTKRYSHCEAYAYGVHGRIAIKEGTEESARRAEAYFEKSLQVFEAIGDANGIATAKSNIAYVQSKYDYVNNNEELMKVSQELYDLRVTELGEENEYTIEAGRIYAIDLRKANRWEEARELLMKLLATSKQVFGSDHNITKIVESML